MITSYVAVHILLQVPAFIVSLMPILIAHVASRYKQTWQMQTFLFFLSIASGTRMIYLINRGSWLVNMKQVSSNFAFLLHPSYAKNQVPSPGHRMGVCHCTTSFELISLKSGLCRSLGLVERIETSFLIVNSIENYILVQDFS
jgi:hypothetical protein